MVYSNDTETGEIINDNIDDFIAGIKLPKTETGWIRAGDINISNLNISVKNMNNIIDECFAKNFGTIDQKQLEHELNEKYKDYGKQQLKRELRELKKKQNKDVASIRLMSKLLRKKIDNKNNKIFLSVVMLKLENTFGDTLKLSLIMMRI